MSKSWPENVLVEIDCCVWQCLHLSPKCMSLFHNFGVDCPYLSIRSLIAILKFSRNFLGDFIFWFYHAHIYFQVLSQLNQLTFHQILLELGHDLYLFCLYCVQLPHDIFHLFCIVIALKVVKQSG